ncbi:hypothetical protein GIB67_005291 [Kingdonia uniflora]|uniref:Uncharacterized protein n=1 Tax=Kingdonia uniflora TaxID=39325 RepID=A0A7J7LCH3_9MAGN|nr:hypothetical protein GIB67_005291 [Kingdonia uniflora]
MLIKELAYHLRACHPLNPKYYVDAISEIPERLVYIFAFKYIGPNSEYDYVGKLKVEKAHDADLRCVDWNPHDENFILKGYVFIPSIHLAWSPDKATVLGSSAEDGLLNVWDYEKVGKKKEHVGPRMPNSPPGLFFQHAGHRDKVVDFHWKISDPWTIISMSEDSESTGGGNIKLFLLVKLEHLNTVQGTRVRGNKETKSAAKYLTSSSSSFGLYFLKRFLRDKSPWINEALFTRWGQLPNPRDLNLKLELETVGFVTALELLLAIEKLVHHLVNVLELEK